MIKGARAHHIGGKAESLEKRRHRWDLTNVYKHLKERVQKGRGQALYGDVQ